MKTKSAPRVVAAAAACFLLLQTFAFSQAPSAQADKMRAQVQKIGERHDVTLTAQDDKSYHGYIVTIADESVTMNDVDLKGSVQLKYSDIKRVQKGYGGKNGFTGKHTGPRHEGRNALIFGGALIGFFVILLSQID